MQTNLNKTDIIYLIIVTLSAYFLLTLLPGTVLQAYGKLTVLKENGTNIANLGIISVTIGLLFTFGMYLLSRTMFKQSEFSALVASLLMISSSAFINNFMQGGVSDLVYSIFGSAVIPEFSFENIWKTLPLIPLSLISVYLLFAKGKMNYVLTGMAAIIASFFIPLLALPFLFLLTADGISKINHIKDKGITSALAGWLIAATISLIIIKPTIATFILSLLIGMVIAIVILSFENKHTLLYLLTITLIMISVENGMSQILAMQRVDSETIGMLNQLNSLKGTVAVASYYKENITDIAYVEAGREVTSADAFIFIFTNKTPKFDYLLLDTLVLDNAKEYAKIAGTTATLETFAYAGTQQQSGNYYQIFYSAKGDTMILTVDGNGNLLSNQAIINGVDESVFRLLALNSTSPTFERYILPRSDSEKNIFKVLYSDQFGEIAGIKITQIAQSNSSRLRLYSFEYQ